MASLMITSGQQAGTYFQLTNRVLTAGRDPAREIQLLDPRVSRRHFQIRKQGEGYVLLELKNLNGVFVNGDRVEDEVALSDGDIIRAGDTELRYNSTDDDDRTNAIEKHRVASREARDNVTMWSRQTPS